MVDYPRYITRIVHMGPDPVMSLPLDSLPEVISTSDVWTASGIFHRDDLTIELAEAIVARHPELEEQARTHPCAPLDWIEMAPIGSLPGYVIDSYLLRATLESSQVEAILQAHSTGLHPGGPPLGEVVRRSSTTPTGATADGADPGATEDS